MKYQAAYLNDKKRVSEMRHADAMNTIELAQCIPTPRDDTFDDQIILSVFGVSMTILIFLFFFLFDSVSCDVFLGCSRLF